MAASSSSVSCPEFKECCPRPSRPYPRPPPPRSPRPPRADDVAFAELSDSDEGVSDEDDDCFCIPFPWLLQYHRARLGNPDLTETQLCQYFRDNLKRDATDDDFNLEDWDIEWSREDSRCYLAAKGAPQPHYQNRCIVTGLSKDTTIEELDDLFGRAGMIVESKIMKDKKTGESDGYGFVSFEYEKCMFDAIQLLNGHVLRGHTLTVFESINRGYPGTKDRSRSDVPPGTKDDDVPPCCP
ncbi:hypothetical protein RIF29_24798 [Crotalaria pallida]|uniref:RRM domain-containing protein n=1 Tax=Crotalaria pallida TaxID=3830 RepID=A0AAN9EL40_CROPI